MTPIVINLPMRIESVANLREHWARRAARAKSHKGAAFIAAMAHGVQPFKGKAATVTMTRIAPRMLDDDNLAGGFKAVRDGIAAAMGIYDNDLRVRWRYAQRKGDVREYAVELVIEEN